MFEQPTGTFTRTTSGTALTFSASSTTACTCPFNFKSTDNGATCTAIVQTQSRTRTVVSPDAACVGTSPSGQLTEQRVCSHDACWCYPSNEGTWKAWAAASGADGQCSSACGGGWKKEVRSIQWPNPECHGKAPAGALVRMAACNTQCCPKDETVSAWGAWTSCSKTCGVGSKTRTRTVVKPDPACVGATNTKALSQSSDCNTECCPVQQIGTWSDWSACQTTCGTGNRTKERSAVASNLGQPGFCLTAVPLSGPSKMVEACSVPTACKVTSTIDRATGTKWKDESGADVQPTVRHSCDWDYQTGTLVITFHTGSGMPLAKNAAGENTASNTMVVVSDKWASQDYPTATSNACSGSTVCDFANTVVTINNVLKLSSSTVLPTSGAAEAKSFNDLPDITANVKNSVSGATMGSFQVCKAPKAVK